MATGVISWSQTAASNASADSSVNWAEGMAPSAVNDSARATMASVAKWRDDLSGSIVTTGTSTAYAVTSNQVQSALTAGYVIAFSPHTTNGATVTLNVDALGAKPLRSAPGVELPAGVIAEGTPYVATYYSSNSGEWILHGFYGNPYNVPIGGGMIYLGTTAPNSSFVFPYGQALSRTTYATLFSQVSTSFGAGDGSTTFNVLDLRGRYPAGKDNMGGTAAGRVTSAAGGVDGTTMGATGGAQTTTLAQTNLPNVAFSSSSLAAASVAKIASADAFGIAAGSSPSGVDSGTAVNVFTTAQASSIGVTTTISGTVPSGGSGTAFSRLPPSVIVPWIIRVI